jgi:hypothetical protein
MKLAVMAALITLFSMADGFAPALASEPKPEKVILYQNNFEDGQGIVKEMDGDPYGLWGGGRTQLSLEPPQGMGNSSKKALTFRGKKLKYTGASVPFFRQGKHPGLPPANSGNGLIVEPQGWDGGMSFKIYNGGFKSLTVSYRLLFPNDVTVHNCPIEAPEGKWIDCDLPLDKFLYHGRRPRRGAELELLTIFGEGPKDDETFFQLDDAVLYRVKQLHPRQPKPKPPLPQGVIYQQDFDDPNDFDFESYMPATTNCNVYRIAGGVDQHGKPLQEPDKPGDSGCLKIECYEKAAEFMAGRPLEFPIEGARIEFDCFLKGATDMCVNARYERNLITKGRFRQYVGMYPGGPRQGRWLHFSIATDDFRVKRDKDGRPSFFALYFTAHADAGNEHYILIDNLVVRLAREDEQKK